MPHSGRRARKRGVAFEIEQAGVGLAHEAKRAGDGDVGMADAGPNQYGACAAGALILQHRQHIADLRLAAIDPCLRGLRVERPLVEQAHRLVGEPGRQGADLAARGAAPARAAAISAAVGPATSSR